MMIPGNGLSEVRSLADRLRGSASPSTGSSAFPIVIAHRGIPVLAPENTLPSFDEALRLGARFVELDYWQAGDGTLVVLHDETLDRTTDAARRLGRSGVHVHECSAEQLADLDAGTWFSEAFRGTALPTLRQAIERIGLEGVPVLERKGGSARATIELLEELDCVESVVVMAFDWDFLADCRETSPNLALIALGDGPLAEESIGQARRAGAWGMGWNQKSLRPESIALVRSAGLFIWSYTINDPIRASDLVAAGLTGIITDDVRSMLPAFNSP